MRLRARLPISHGLIAITIGTVCLICVFALTLADSSRSQLRTTYDELHDLDALGNYVNHFAEQIAELFPMQATRDALVERDQARDELLGSLAGLRESTDVALSRPDLAADQRAALEWQRDWLQSSAETAVALEAVAEEIEAALKAGDTARAARLYAVEVENRLDARISSEIEQAVELEGVEVAATLENSDRITRLTWLLAVSVMAIGALAAVATAFLLDRLVSRPVAKLTADVDALAADAGIAPAAPATGDELHQLADRFSAMAVEIRNQRHSLRTARDTLAAQVAERTASLEERSRELTEANRRLTELNDTRVQFFADISHELRTPLTVLRGHAEVAARNGQATREDLLATLQVLIRKAGQLGRLVDELLFVARSEGGVMTVDRQPVFIHDVMAEALSDAMPLLERQVTIGAREPQAPILVNADPVRLRQAMMILLDNAARHAPAQSTIHVTLAAVDGGARFSVADEGPGFSDEERAHAFERFFRGRPKTGPRSRGLGLGLSIARWIVERHDGRLWIEARQHGGAEVCIWLAAVPADGPGETGR